MSTLTVCESLMKYKGEVYSLLLTCTTITTFLSVSQEQFTTVFGALGRNDFGQSLTESSGLDLVPFVIVGDVGDRSDVVLVSSTMSESALGAQLS